MNREELTRESLTKQIDSPFQLVAVAISVARHAIRSGRQMSLEEVLECLRQGGASALDDLIAMDAVEERQRHLEGEEEQQRNALPPAVGEHGA